MLSLEDSDNTHNKEYVQDNDNHNRNSQYENAQTEIYPALFIFVVESKYCIGKGNNRRTEPSKNSNPCNPDILIDKGLDQDQMEEETLTQHPEVGGKHEVSGKDMKNSAPDSILEENSGIKDNKFIPKIILIKLINTQIFIIPKQPRDVIESQRYEHILMDGDPATVEGTEAIENNKGEKEHTERYNQPRYCHVIDNGVKVSIF